MHPEQILFKEKEEKQKRKEEHKWSLNLMVILFSSPYL